MQYASDMKNDKNIFQNFFAKYIGLNYKTVKPNLQIKFKIVEIS